MPDRNSFTFCRPLSTIRNSLGCLLIFCTACCRALFSLFSSIGFTRYQKGSASYVSNTYSLLDEIKTKSPQNCCSRNNSAVCIPSSPCIIMSKNTRSNWLDACKSSRPLLNWQIWQGM